MLPPIVRLRVWPRRLSTFRLATLSKVWQTSFWPVGLYPLPRSRPSRMVTMGMASSLPFAIVVDRGEQ